MSFLSQMPWLLSQGHSRVDLMQMNQSQSERIIVEEKDASDDHQCNVQDDEEEAFEAIKAKQAE